MREDEHRCVERRVGTPRALPLRVLVPSGVAKLSGPHDLRTDLRSEQPQEGVIDAAGATWLAEHLAAPSGGEHPLMQPFAGVTERRVVALTFTGGEPRGRDGDELESGHVHSCFSFGNRGSWFPLGGSIKVSRRGGGPWSRGPRAT